MPSACRQMGRGVLSMSVYKPSPLFFQSKAGPQSKERASVGVLQQRRKMDSVGLFGRGCAFLARWMAPSALAVMQHNAAVSQPPLVLAAGAWHGHSAPAAPARPHPGLGLPLAAAGSCFYLVMLLQLDVASGGPGHLAVKGGGALLFGMTPSAPPVGQWDSARTKGRPAELMQAERAGLRCGPESDLRLRDLSGREGLQGGQARWCAEALVQSVSGVALFFCALPIICD